MVPHSLRISIIIPFIFGLICISLLTVMGAHTIRKNEMQKDVDRIAFGASDLWQQLVDQDAETLHALLEFLSQDNDLAQAWKTQDRQALQDFSQPLFKSLHQKYNITHFYFHGLDQVNFLRVHKPEKYGDTIERFTLSQAVEQGQPSHGVELGVLGTLTLRVVHPWIIDGQLAGYLELGVEVKHIIRILGRILGAELLVTVNKELLDEAGWQDGHLMLNTVGNWQQLPGRVLFGSTFEEVPEPLMVFLRQMGKPMGSINTVNVGPQIFTGKYLGLTDVSGRVIGNITILLDISNEVQELRKLFLGLSILAILLNLGLIWFFYSYLGRIEVRLQENMTEINSANRLLVDQKEELQAALDNVNTLSGLLPVCAGCKKIRDDKGYWKQMEVYIAAHSDMDFSHSICPECADRLYPGLGYEEY